MRERTEKFIVILGSIVWGLWGALGAFSALFVVMLFDAPGSADKWATKILALSVVGFPVFCFISILMAWLAMEKGCTRRACLWMLLPLVSLAVGIGAEVWIDVYQNGRLGG